MSLKKNKLSLAALTVVLTLQGCGTVESKITESDILNAERNGTLQTLYHEIANGTGRGKALKPADKASYLKRIGARLASQTAQAILAAMNANRLPNNAVPVSVLDEQGNRVEVLRNWDPAQYDETLATINAEMAITEKAIAATQAQLKGFKQEQLRQKYAAVQTLKLLNGDANRQSLEQKEYQLLSDTYDQVDQFIGQKDFDRAINGLKDLIAVAPKFKDVVAKLADLENIALQESFVSYVNNGETEQARKLLSLIYKGKYFQSQKDIIMPKAMELANYYIAVAVEATGDENLAEAYRLFNEARAIKSMFGMQSAEVTQEADFVDFIYALYEDANNKKSYGLALGYLHVIAQLRPNFPELETLLRLVNDKVMSTAVKRVSTTAFDDNDSSSSLGRSISSKITQYIFDTLPQDVRVVEREQLNAVLREQEISALRQGTGVQLDSADLLIQGTILEANVETTESPSSRKQRVVTESREMANPEYARWLEKSNSEREKSIKPSRTIIRETKEDIDIKVTHVRKVAVLSISYRVVDAKSARVVYADSVMDKKKVSDETTEGVKLGIFEAPYKIADLPSDSELLSALTVNLSKLIGAKVVELLKDPEIEYEKDSKQRFDERNFVGATEQMAKALVMSQSKNKPFDALLQSLREYAVTARLEN